MAKLEITKERILRAVEENPEAEKTLKSLFPEAFEDNRVFCKVGTILKRKSYPKNFYAVFKWNGEVRFLNVTDNKFWHTDKERNLKLSQLKDCDGNTITYGEFNRLIGNQRIGDFSVVSADSK